MGATTGDYRATAGSMNLGVTDEPSVVSFGICDALTISDERQLSARH